MSCPSIIQVLLIPITTPGRNYPILAFTKSVVGCRSYTLLQVIFGPTNIWHSGHKLGLQIPVVFPRRPYAVYGLFWSQMCHSNTNWVFNAILTLATWQTPQVRIQSSNCLLKCQLQMGSLDLPHFYQVDYKSGVASSLHSCLIICYNNSQNSGKCYAYY